MLDIDCEYPPPTLAKFSSVFGAYVVDGLLQCLPHPLLDFRLRNPPGGGAKPQGAATKLLRVEIAFRESQGRESRKGVFSLCPHNRLRTATAPKMTAQCSLRSAFHLAGGSSQVAMWAESSRGRAQVIQKTFLKPPMPMKWGLALEERGGDNQSWKAAPSTESPSSSIEA